MMISKAARIAALLVGGSAMVAATAAEAQSTSRVRSAQEEQEEARRQQGRQGQQPAPAAAAQRQLDLSRAEQRALQPLVTAGNAAFTAQQAGQTPDWAAVQALIPAAQAAARGEDARYLVAKAQYAVAQGTRNDAGREAAIVILLASPSTPAEEATVFRAELSQLKNKRAEAAFAANDFATAERLYVELVRDNPNDTRLANNLAIVRRRSGNTDGALTPVVEQIRTAEANGGRASEALYRQARDTLYTARNAQASEYALKLARNYPTPANWRDAIRIQREVTRLDDEAVLVAYRLQRAANALEGEADYQDYITLVRRSGSAGETKAAIDAGIAARAISNSTAGISEDLRWANENIATDRAGLDREVNGIRTSGDARTAMRIGHALYGYGRYAEAAEVYRIALGKPGANANVLNLHLGASLAMANQRAEAETALRAVTGPTAGLAQLWLGWMGRHQG